KNEGHVDAMRTVIFQLATALMLLAAATAEAQQAPAAKATTESAAPAKAGGTDSMGSEEELFAAAKRQGCPGLRAYVANSKAKYIKEAKALIAQDCGSGGS